MTAGSIDRHSATTPVAFPPGWARSIGMAALLCACGTEPAPDVDPDSTRPRHSVLLVSIDTARADRITCYGGPPGVSPRIDDLASRGVRFESCSSPVPHTLPSHTTMMTGEYPPVHGVRVNGLHQLPDAAITLAEVRRDAGAATAAFPSARVLEATHGLAQGFDVYDDDILVTEGVQLPMRKGMDSVARFADWLDTLDPDQPFFAWVHFFEPHLPWDPPPALAARFTPYLAEIHEADRAAGALWDELERRGRLEDTLICLTSDHGESLGEHGEDTHGVFVYESVLWVPLVFSGPGIAQQSVGTRVSLVDITPTILDFVGLEPFPCGGISLAPVLRGERTSPPARPLYMETYVPYVSFGWSPQEAWIAQDYKLIESARPELYNLGLDPRELTDLYDREPDRVAAMRQQLQAFRADRSRAIDQERLQVDEDLLAQLTAMGYTVQLDPDFDAFPSPGTAAGADPKDRTELLDPLYKMMAAGVRGDRKDTLSIGLGILKIEPENPTALQHVGVERCSRGEHVEAVRLLGKLEEGGRSTMVSLLSLGVSLFHLGETEQAVRTLRRSLELDPANPRILRWIGDAEARLGNIEEAIATYRLALADPEVPAQVRRFIEDKIKALEKD